MEAAVGMGRFDLILPFFKLHEPELWEGLVGSGGTYWPSPVVFQVNSFNFLIQATLA